MRISTDPVGPRNTFAKEDLPILLATHVVTSENVTVVSYVTMVFEIIVNLRCVYSLFVRASQPPL